MKASAPLLAGLLLVALLPINLCAQYPGNPHGLTVRQTFINYNFPFTYDAISPDHYGLGLEFSYLRAMGRQVNLAVPVRAGMVKLPLSETRFEDARLTASMDLVFQIKLARPDHFMMPYLFAGAGAQVEQWDEPRYVFVAPGGVGLNFRLAPHLYLNLEGAYRFAPMDDYRDHLQLGAGFWVVLGKYDHNRDFRRAKKKKEIVLPPPPMAAPIAETKPEKPVADALVVPIFPDRDGDGVPDHLDVCPDEPGLPKHQGCPDSDGDGVPDHLDMCPGVPGSAETQGCPDTDGDGIPDHLDACPEHKGPASTRGCPDMDRDGVPDYEDKCPTVPGPSSNFGCPEPTEIEMEALQSAMYSIRFAEKSTQLPSEAYPVLNNVADILKRYPHYHLKIRSHTHNLGSDSDNLRLTEKRASYIYDYLVGSGITAQRISYEGIGEREPIANNKYAPGRAQNERTELILSIP
jgi:outer membrane protein OmpA-like peptidoglycan-associated protein